MRTLVLDQGYQPHRVVSWQRAVTMLFAGKVEVLEAYDEEVRSPSISLGMPAVVRLLRALRARRHRIRFSRMNVALRDDFRCQYCSTKLPLRELTFDHVVPRTRGGKTTWENVVMACRPCNGRKGARTPVDAGMTLRKPPLRPRYLPAATFQVQLGGDVPDAWTQWVSYWNASPD